MNAPLIDPFSLQRQAFRQEAADQLGPAFESHAAAIAAFSSVLDDPAFLRIATMRAQRIPGVRNPGDVAQGLQNELPAWLADLHFDRVRKCISGEDFGRAACHWRMLELCARYPNLAGTVLLEQRRRLLLESRLNRKILDKNEAERAREIANAERLISSFSPLEILGRDFAMGAYVIEFEQTLRLLYPRAKQEAGDLPAMAPKPLKPEQARRLRTRLGRYARRLRRHVTVLGRSGSEFRDAVVRALIVLARYLLVTGDHALALRMVRRARRIDPDSKEVPVVAIWLRRASRRR